MYAYHRQGLGGRQAHWGAVAQAGALASATVRVAIALSHRLQYLVLSPWGHSELHLCSRLLHSRYSLFHEGFDLIAFAAETFLKQILQDKFFSANNSIFYTSNYFKKVDIATPKPKK